MGLKVLLADDSSAIAKVVQICLQDFGVEVKSICSGKDVLDVARSFKPDIAFIDVMLPHKPGYQVAEEIKNDQNLKKTPVIMLWSSFMEFDEDKYKKCQANDRLEKPFEAKDIRQIVQKYIAKAQTQPISEHLKFPKVKETKQWDMSSFEDVSKFAEAEKVKKDPDSDWVRKDLGAVEDKFKINISPDGEEIEENTVSFQYDDSKIKDLSFVLKATVNDKPAATSTVATPVEVPSAPIETPKAPEKPKTSAPITNTSTTAAPITEDEIKKLVAEEVRKLVAQIVPDLAEQLIKEEIQKLTQ
ncbi:MAG: response regulator [Oligoflexia bacterium]|nr:response regulator [Oligoflexia bacterium]